MDVYRLEGTGLFVQLDGTFVPDVADDDREFSINDLSESEIGALMIRGQLATMSRNETTGAAVTPLIEAGLAYYELAVLILEGIEALHELNEDRPDPLLEALSGIHRELLMIRSLSLAVWATEREESLDELKGDVGAAFNVAVRFARSGADYANPVWSPRLAIALERSDAALVRLSSIDTGLWLRPVAADAFGPGAGFDWNQWLPDPDLYDFDRVWDYLWALPVLMYVMTVRAAVLMNCEPDQLYARREIHQMELTIGQVLNRMQAGVHYLKDLPPGQLERTPNYGLPFAAADVAVGTNYSGLLGYPYHPSSFPKRLEQPPANCFSITGDWRADSVITSNRISRFGWNVVCRQIGLLDVLRFAGTLQNLAGSPVLGEPFQRTLDQLAKIRLRNSDEFAAAKLAVDLSNLVPSSAPSDMFEAYKALVVEPGAASDMLAGALRVLALHGSTIELPAHGGRRQG